MKIVKPKYLVVSSLMSIKNLEEPQLIGVHPLYYFTERFSKTTILQELIRSLPTNLKNKLLDLDFLDDPSIPLEGRQKLRVSNFGSSINPQYQLNMNFYKLIDYRTVQDTRTGYTYEFDANNKVIDTLTIYIKISNELSRIRLDYNSGLVQQKGIEAILKDALRRANILDKADILNMQNKPMKHKFSVEKKKTEGLHISKYVITLENGLQYKVTTQYSAKPEGTLLNLLEN